MSSQVIGEFLHALLWPSLDAFEELSLMLVMELLNTSLELDLSSSQRMNLLEFLQIEECLRDRQLVAASRRGQETLELGPIRKLKDEFVDLPQWLWVHVFEFFPLKDCLHEEGSHLVDVAVL